MIRPKYKGRLIEIPIRLDRYLRFEAVSGRGKPVADRLLKNFWTLLIGMITYSNMYMVEVNGTAYAIRVTGDIAYGGTRRIYTCSDNVELAFNAYSCSVVEIFTSEDSWSLYTSGSNSIFEVVKTATKVANSSLLAFGLNDTSGGVRTMAMSHVLQSIQPSAQVVHRLVAATPFLFNLVAALRAIYHDTDAQSVVDMSGTTVYLKGSGTILAGAARLYLGTGTKPVSPTDYTLTNPTLLSTAIYYTLTDTYARIDIYGSIYPNVDTTFTEVGLAWRLYDTGGQARDVLIMRYLLPQPLTAKAGKVYTIRLSLYGS